MDQKDTVSFETQVKDGCVVLTPLVKELTFKNSKDFLAKSKMIVEDHDKAQIVLDLVHVGIIDSMSLGTLVALLKHAKKTGGDLCVTNLAEPIKVLFNLLNFNSVFRCFASVDAAVAGCKSKS